MTGSDIATKVLENLGSRTDKATAVYYWINFAIQQLNTVYTWSDLHKFSSAPTVDGQTKYGLPSTLKDILSIKVLDGDHYYPMVEMPAEKERDRVFTTSESNDTGRPQRYARYSNWIELWPQPDAATYTMYLRWTKFHPTVAAGTTIEFGDHFEWCIVAGATHFAYADLQEPDDARFWGGIFTTAIQQLHVMERRRPNYDKIPMSERFPGNDLRRLSSTPWLDPFIRRT